MHYELYVDRVFFTQFVMHLLLLLMTSVCGRFRTLRWKLVISAAAGSFIYLLILLLPLGDSYAALTVKILMHTAGSLLMLQLTFGFTSVSYCMRGGMIYGICACLVGGAMTVFQRGTVRNGWQIGVSSAALVLVGIGWIKREQRCQKPGIYTVRLWEGGKCVKVKAFLDSGNSLTDPLSHTPVCVVSGGLIDELGVSGIPERFRAVPYHSVGKAHGIMPAWKVERMELCVDGQIREIMDVLLAESDVELSGTKQYQMLLHPALLEEKKGEKHDFKSSDAGKDAV